MHRYFAFWHLRLASDRVDLWCEIEDGQYRREQDEQGCLSVVTTWTRAERRVMLGVRWTTYKFGTTHRRPNPKEDVLGASETLNRSGLNASGEVYIDVSRLIALE
jgi:hypothetical protein